MEIEMTHEEEIREVRDWNEALAIGETSSLRIEMIGKLIDRMKDELERAGLHMGAPAIVVLAEEIKRVASLPFSEGDQA